MGEWQHKEASAIAFPSAFYQQKQLHSVLALHVDAFDRLWLLDHAFHGSKGAPRLLAFHLREKRSTFTLTSTPLAQSARQAAQQALEQAPVVDFSFPAEAAGVGSFLSDLAIDVTGSRGDHGGVVYICDSSSLQNRPALLVFDVQQRTVYRLLSAHSLLYAPSAYINSYNSQVKDGSWLRKLFGAFVDKEGGVSVLPSRGHAGSLALGRQHLYLSSSDALYQLDDVTVLTSTLLQSHADAVGDRNNTSAHRAMQRRLDQIVLKSLQKLAVSPRRRVTDGHLVVDAHSTSPIILQTVARSNALVAVAAPLSSQSSASVLPFVTYETVTVLQSPELLHRVHALSFGPYATGLYLATTSSHTPLSTSWQRLFLGVSSIPANAQYKILRVNKAALREAKLTLSVSSSPLSSFPASARRGQAPSRATKEEVRRLTL